MRTARSRKKFGFEQLEDRSVLSGIVMVDLIADSLFIIGSAHANALTLTDDGTNFVVTGIVGGTPGVTRLSTNTGVSIDATETVATIPKTLLTDDLYIHLLRGRDELHIDGLNALHVDRLNGLPLKRINDSVPLYKGEINITCGEDVDLVTMGQTATNFVANKLWIDLDEGNDTLKIDDLLVDASNEDDVTIVAGWGDDTITLGARAHNLIDGNLRIDSGFANDTVTVDRTYAFSNMIIETEGGDDIVMLGRANPVPGVNTSVQVRGSLIVDTFLGPDFVHIDNVFVKTHIIVNTGEDNDQVILGDNPNEPVNPLTANNQQGPSAGGDFVITTEFGVANVNINYTTGANAALIDLRPGSQQHASTLVIRNSSFSNDVAILGSKGPETIDIDALNIISNLFISSGGGDDRIDLQGLLVTQGVLTINTATGNDSVRIDNSVISHFLLFAEAGINQVEVTANLIADFFLDLGLDGGSANLSGVAFRRGFARGAASATASGNLFGAGSNLIVEGF